MEKLEIIEGVAVKTTANIVMKKDEVLDYKADIEQQIMNCESQIIINQKKLEDAQQKLAECEAICAELGY